MTAAATIRPAVTDDLDGIVRLADAKRGQYASYQPVFWRPAADATVVAITDHEGRRTARREGAASQQHGDLIDNHLMDQVSQVAAVSCRDLGRPVRARMAQAP